MRRFRLCLAGAVIGVGLVWGAAASAEQPASAVPALDMTTIELQSLSCLGFGSVSAGTATVLVILSPLEALTLPVIAGTFAAGCAVGAMMAPGLAWIARNASEWYGSEPSEPAAVASQ